MSLVGIVSISVLAALFLFALLAGLAGLIWLATRLKHQLSEIQKERELVHAETKAALDAAKSSLSSVRSAIQQMLETHQKSLTEVLQEHRKEMNAGIERINADALTSVAARLTQVCIRTEKAIGVLQQLVLDTEKSSGTEYGPEEFAPEESTFGAPPSGYAVSQTAALDQQADASAAAEVSTDSVVEV